MRERNSYCFYQTRTLKLCIMYVEHGKLWSIKVECIFVLNNWHFNLDKLHLVLDTETSKCLNYVPWKYANPKKLHLWCLLQCIHFLLSSSLPPMYNICYVYCTLKDKLWSLFNCLKQRQVNRLIHITFWR